MTETSDFLTKETNDIVNIGLFLKNEMNNKPVVILDNLKKEINGAITFFTDNNNIKTYDEVITNIQNIKLKGYESMMKINSYLSILLIKDKNQTNKYEYEKCMSSTLISKLTYFSTYFEDLKKPIIETEIDKEISLCKNLPKDDDDTEKKSHFLNFKLGFDNKILLKKTEILGEYTIFINEIILALYIIKEILKDVSISESSSW